MRALNSKRRHCPRGGPIWCSSGLLTAGIGGIVGHSTTIERTHLPPDEAISWGERFESVVKMAGGEIYMEHGEGDER